MLPKKQKEAHTQVGGLWCGLDLVLVFQDNSCFLTKVKTDLLGEGSV